MMLEQMTSSEFGEAMAYASIDPCGEFRNELRHGQIMHLLDRVNFKRNEPLQPLDFMNFMDRPPEPELTPEQIEAQLNGIFGA